MSSEMDTGQAAPPDRVTARRFDEVAGTGPRAGTFTERLITARESIRRPDGKMYTLEEIAEGVRSYTGDTCSKQYIGDLLSGKYTAPTQPKIEGIAHFFGLPPSYFFNDPLSVQMEEDLKLGAALREAGVHGIAARMLEVDPAKRNALMEILNEIQNREHVAQSGDSQQGGSDQ
jgi:transcriptional regulator with XRE-family HTH domain